MKRTALALTLAPVAGGARPCIGFGHGHQWRTRSMVNMESTNVTTVKRPARPLGIATT